MYVKAIKREPYLLWLVAGLALVGVYFFFLASGSVQDLMSPALALAASLVILLRSFRFEGALRLAWILIGVGFLQSAIGDGLWTLYEVVWEIEPFPSYADLFYLAFYPLIAAGLVTLVRWHRAGGRDSLVDASIVGIGGGDVTWVFGVAPGVALTKLDGTAKGGVALAVREQLGVPVKLVGTGEGLEDLEPFEARA